MGTNLLRGTGYRHLNSLSNMTSLVLNVIYIGYYHSFKEYYMKKIFSLFLLILLAATVFAVGPAEVQPEPVDISPIEITLLSFGAANFKDFGTDHLWVIDALKKDFPNVEVEVLQVDLADGSAMTMTAQLAAGDGPNIYQDTMVRTSAYILPEFALPLDGYIRDLDKYSPSTLAPYRRGGDLLAMPLPGGAQGMAINLDMMVEIGYEVPDNWTIDDFLEMAALVKLKYGGDKWATGMFAANQSGDYLINNWFAAFGVEYYDAGDYSETTIKSTGGVKVYEFFQHLMTEGYIRGDAAMQVDDDYVLDWAMGKLAATAFFQPWTKYYFGVVAEQGYERFDYKFVPFPRGDGVDSVPTYYSTGAMVVRETGTDEDAVAARMVEYLNSPMIQALKAVIDGNMPNRNDVELKPSDKWTAQISAIVDSNGIFDIGLTNSKFGATRPQHYPILMKVLNFKLSPEEAITAYEKALNEALK